MQVLIRLEYRLKSGQCTEPRRHLRSKHQGQQEVGWCLLCLLPA